MRIINYIKHNEANHNMMNIHTRTWQRTGVSLSQTNTYRYIMKRDEAQGVHDYAMVR